VVEQPSVTQFAIPVDTDTGPVLIQVDIGDDGELLTTTVDTMSPLTVLGSGAVGGPIPAERRRRLSLTLVASGPGVDPVARARLGGVDALDLHVCRQADETTITDYCKVGMEGSGPGLRDIHGILGADVLSRYAVRFAVSTGLMSFFPDIAGTALERSELCEAVFPAPFYGGGTMVFGGTEIPFSGRRIAVGTCFFDSEAEVSGRVCPPTDDSPDERGKNWDNKICPKADISRGVDGLFVISTGLGITLVADSAYEQYRLLHPEAPAPDALAQATLQMPAGPIQVRLGATLRDLALVGEVSDKRGPCSERYANDFLNRCGACDKTKDSDDRSEDWNADCECPCATTRDDDKTQFCKAGAVVELKREFAVALIADSEPMLQALRSELRPELPDVSGIIGVNALEPLVVNVDYPNNRVLARCEDPATCLVRPAVLSSSGLARTRACLPAVMQVCESAVANPTLCSLPSP
jgi:hypothetical protein